MALTGLPIKGVDARKVGLVDGVLDKSKNYELFVGDIVSSQEPGTYDAKHMFWN